MRWSIAALVCVVSGIFGSPARADTYVDGNELVESCNASENDSVYFSKTAECRGFITGVADSGRCDDTLNGFGWDIPSNVTRGQLVKVTTQWLNQHPEKLHLGASGLVAHALEEAFPCQ